MIDRYVVGSIVHGRDSFEVSVVYLDENGRIVGRGVVNIPRKHCENSKGEIDVERFERLLDEMVMKEIEKMEQETLKDLGRIVNKPRKINLRKQKIGEVEHD